jgi:pyruvate dehydrogenase (quinone)
MQPSFAATFDLEIREVEAMVDPLALPVPAKVTLDQATKFAESLARGEPNRSQIAWTVLSDKVRELI